MRLSVEALFGAVHDRLQLEWLSGRERGERFLDRSTDNDTTPKTRLLGPWSYNVANRIQLIGPAEARLIALDGSFDPDRFEYAPADTTALFLLSNRLEPPPALAAFANAHGIPLMVSALNYGELQKNLRHQITRLLAERRIIHGVLLDVLGLGVLMTGGANIGKSELALELISRGHILVADDAPEFRRIAPGTLEGSCPPLLEGFLEVRGLGVLNIARMYGDAHVRRRKTLKFIVDLLPADSEHSEALAESRLCDSADTRDILGVSIPLRKLAVAPGRNLAVLIEAAVRDQLLRYGGYSATRDLIEQQARAIERSRPTRPEDT